MKDVDESRKKIHTVDLPNLVPQQIDDLVTRYNVTYARLATIMGVSRMSLHSVRKNTRIPSLKFIAKFEAARRRLEIGKLNLPAPDAPEERLLILAVKADFPREYNTLGLDEVLAKLRDGHGAPIIIKLKQPSIATGLQLIHQALLQNNCTDLLKACLPLPYDCDEWIERLSGPSYLYAVKKCVALMLGSEWEKDLTMLIQAIEKQRSGTGKGNSTQDKAPAESSPNHEETLTK